MTTNRGGPPKTPTKLKILRGETRPSQLNKNEAQPPLGDPSIVPDGFDADEAKVWNHLAPQLADKRLFTSWDAYALECFCRAVVEGRRAAVKLREGLLVKTERGYVKNPAHQIHKDACGVILKFAREYGLTPASRAGIQLPEGEPGDEDVTALLS